MFRSQPTTPWTLPESNSNPSAQRLKKAPGFSAFIERLANYRWPQSIAFNLAFAILVGFLYSLWVMGPRPLNPRNTDWLTQDGAQHEIAWELFRQDPKLHWPLTFTDRIGYPEGESVSLLDPNSLIAVLLKPFSRVLSNPFQYQGPEVIVICILQFFFALMVFRVLFGRNAFAVVLPSMFFLLSPPLVWRFVGHYAMDHHWLLLASLLLFCVSQRETPIPKLHFLGYAVLLIAIVIPTNPYLTLQVLLILAAAIVSLVWRRRITVAAAVGIVAVIGIVGYIVASAFGLIIPGGRGYDAGGYRDFSFNLLGLFDPQNYGSLLLPKIPAASWKQYEGYNYLGLGIIVLALISPAPLIRQRRNIPYLQRRILIPLLSACLVATALALSTKITFGPWVLIDLDPHQKLTPYLGALRASGRLFWLAYYVLFGGVLSATILCFEKARSLALLSSLLVVQFADTHMLRRWVNSEVNKPRLNVSPLRNPVWSKLGSIYQDLIIMPAWQCGVDATPGGENGYRTFGLLAAAQHMRINSYYAARYAEGKRQIQCGTDMSAVSRQALSPDSAYVVTFELAQQISQGPTGPGKCHNVDRFILCSPKNDLGLSPLVNPGNLLKTAILDSDFEERDLSPWLTYQDVSALVSTAQFHDGQRSLSQANGVGSVYQDVIGLEPGKKYTVTAWISASPGTKATAQIALYDPGANAASSSSPLIPSQAWKLVVHSVIVKAPGTLRIHLFRNQGSGTIFWDDVRIYREQ